MDGSKPYHNKTRFTPADKNTYDTIVKNIQQLVQLNEKANVTVRINYTPENVADIDKIADSFSPSVRERLRIMPQIVWQYKRDINPVDDTIHGKLSIFSEKGYRAENVYLKVPNGLTCYADNMLQYVVNYDGNVFKCTARNFKDLTGSIGKINKDGKFIPSSAFYNYYTASYFENDKCMECRYLPSCYGMCIQKKVEKAMASCPKDDIALTLQNQLKLIIRKSESRLI